MVDPAEFENIRAEICASGPDAPFPSERYFAGARQFPHLVTLDTTEPLASMLRRAWAGLEAFDKPFLTAFAEHEQNSRP